MTTLDERLAEIRKRTEGLVPGPWTWSVGSVEALDYEGDPVMIFEREDRHVTTRNDAAFVAHARTDVPALLAAVDAVLGMHQESDFGECIECTRASTEESVPFPCPTLQGVSMALGVDHE